ncbi:hypothetical protein [Limnohabitans sp. 63ED37-2]|uniref:hypothetical protein n=1 Tax=Limnohabitans sp. 63ED37-2 TaxID=1678128 RepID=UPI000706A161|nr:hypothetical protein [Limnohabitans sp. 63ED37-2]ALK87346.1 hypothetical protein L63ED372_00117 [Limnohabitans sp. 63ED37-2]
MNQSPEQLALQHHMALCQSHAEALQDALQDMRNRALNVDDYTHLNKADRRLLDQFAYRYTRLQDDMGAKLIPAVLKALGEDIAPLSALDRFARLEQLGWLASADEWQTLRQIRNQFAHDYSDNPTERFERQQAAVHAAVQLMSVLTRFQSKSTPAVPPSSRT